MNTSSPMRILHAVEFYDPSVGGAQEVVRQISRRFAAQGHDVTVATTWLGNRSADVIDGVNIRQFRASGNRIHGFTGDVDQYRRFLTTAAFDVVLFYAAQQWTLDAAIPVLGDIRAAKLLAPCGFSGLSNPAYRDYFLDMRSVLARFDRLVFHSGTYQDYRFASEHGLADRSVLIPNGCGEDEFKQPETTFRERYGVPLDRPMLLTVGSHTGMKGHAELIRMFCDPRVPPATLVIIGNQPTGLGCGLTCSLRATLSNWRMAGNKRVVLLDPPRADVVAAYKAADLFVFLSNIECSPLVLFESAAAGTPFLAADVGNSAEIAAWTGAGEIVPTRQSRNGRRQADIPSAAAAVKSLLGDPTALQTMGSIGRIRWRDHFTWEKIAARYADTYAETVLKVQERDNR
jgi:L-malate glycosyltransferase